jgi:pSer/pThr/pTyr-binding forkhead associated (FHA) protein
VKPTCAKCGRENLEHHVFCLGCGASLKGAPAPAPAAPVNPAAVRACAVCGNMLPRDFTFCGKCGARSERVPTTRQSQLDMHAVLPFGRLTLLRPDGSDGPFQSLSEGRNPVGRGLGPLFDNDIFLSPRHGELVLTKTGLTVRDTGSLNGVYVRLHEEEVELFAGDYFRVGQQLLLFNATEPLADKEPVVLGSRADAVWGRVAVIVGPGEEGAAFALSGEAMTIGRERGDIVFHDDGYVSGSHARIFQRDGRFYLGDMGSSNGTFFRIRKEYRIETGTAVLFGQQLFRISFAVDPISA